MKIQITKRIFTFLLACIMVCFCVTRPLTVYATSATISATAGVVGIAPEVAIPIILGLLGLAFLSSIDFEALCEWVYDSIEGFCTYFDDTEVIPAYEYEEQIYIPNAVVQQIVYSATECLDLTLKDAYSLGSGLSYVSVVNTEYTGTGADNKYQIIVFSNTAPYIKEGSQSTTVVCEAPCVVYYENKYQTYVDDMSKELTGSDQYTVYNSVITSIDTTENLAPSVTTGDLASQAIAVKGNEGTKTVVVPITNSISVPKVETETKVEVTTASSIDSVDSTVKGISGILSGIWSTIKSIPATIINGISGVLTDIFVPSSDFVTAKVDALTAEFQWIQPIVQSAEDLADSLYAGDAPVVYIHLGNAEGSYNLGGTVPFLDLRWYERYKPTGDAIISGFLWSVLLWKTFINLPGIISGATGEVSFMYKKEEKK